MGDCVTFQLLSAPTRRVGGGADMGWEQADEGWGARAKDWAYLEDT